MNLIALSLFKPESDKQYSLKSAVGRALIYLVLFYGSWAIGFAVLGSLWLLGRGIFRAMGVI